MIKLQNVLLSVDIKITDPKITVASLLNIPQIKIKDTYVLRRSVDVRKKYNPCFCYSFAVEFSDPHTEKSVLKKHNNASPYCPTPYTFLRAEKSLQNKPIVVGSGPAGLFAAYTLCKAGLPPVIIEKGKPVEDRVKDVESFWSGGEPNENSNVQFGEGGAGTFSDGKLNTGIKDNRCQTVLELFTHFGADKDILVNAKPHIGTDVLRTVVKNIRNEILSLGGEYLFETKFEKPLVKNGEVYAIECTKNKEKITLPCERLVLALGNASRDTYKNLLDCGVTLTSKPFAVGVRIEHLQENLNLSQYGENYSKNLPPLEYKLASHLENGRGVYTFCMCPGGVVVNSSSEKNTYVTNGMSYFARDKVNANSALLVGVSEKDFGSHPLDGIAFQRQIEQAAFKATGGKGLPFVTVGEFLGRKNPNTLSVFPTALPSAEKCDLNKVLPNFVTNAIKEALPLFDKKIKGFASDDAILTAPETRSSSPVRILRNELFETNIKGIYPCGEGAGYAGGITSSAVDGIKTAEAVIKTRGVLSNFV